MKFKMRKYLVFLIVFAMLLSGNVGVLAEEKTDGEIQVTTEGELGIADAPGESSNQNQVDLLSLGKDDGSESNENKEEAKKGMFSEDLNKTVLEDVYNEIVPLETITELKIELHVYLYRGLDKTVKIDDFTKTFYLDNYDPTQNITLTYSWLVEQGILSQYGITSYDKSIYTENGSLSDRDINPNDVNLESGVYVYRSDYLIYLKNVGNPTYYVTFKDWNDEVLKIEGVPKGGSATAPPDPTREGYRFVGWDKSFTNVTSDIVVTAQYEEIQIQYWTVTFEDYNGTVLKEESVEHGGDATPPADPERVGYTFAGWAGNYTNVTQDETVIATYTAKTDTTYKVLHYQQDVTGEGYTLKDTENLSGITGALAEAVAKNYVGFVENKEHEDRVASGIIAADGSLELRLYYDIETIEIYVWKDWIDDEIRPMIMADSSEEIYSGRPNSITINLLADGTKVDSITLTNDEENWSGSFTVPKYNLETLEPIVYSVEEEPVEGYMTEIVEYQNEGFAVVNIQTINIPVSKMWNGPEGQEVTINLFKVILQPELSISNGDDSSITLVDTLELSSENQWSGTFEVPKYTRYGQPIQYFIEELQVPNYITGIEGSVEEGFTIVNTFNNHRVNFIAGSNGSLSGTASFTNILHGADWDEAVDVPTPVPNSGYRFRGWTPSSFPGTITQDLTYTAIFERRTSPPRDYDDDEEEIIDEPIPEAPLNKEDHFQYIQGYPDNTVRPEGLITREEVAAVFYRLLTEGYRDRIWTLEEDFLDVMENRWSLRHIATLANGRIIEGYPDGTFRPGNFITRAELATIASRFDNLSPFEGDKFTDIEGHWANEYINSAAEKGWVNGYPDGTFKPNQYITRAEFVTLVNNVLNRRVSSENILPDARNFPDLPETKWYYEAMQEAINSHYYIRLEDGYEEWTEIYYPILDM